MKNIVGQPVSGENFFKRDKIINLIYRRTDSGSCLFMAAPRRVGKTSIMYQLRDNPRDGHDFIYVPTESIDNSELFFKRLFDALLNSKGVSEKIKNSEKSKTIFEMITNRVKKVGAFGVEVELQNTSNEKYADLFLELIKKIDSELIQIVLMIDEFPSTIENILQKSGETEAVHFIKFNRTIRQESAGGIQFIYTGSIGLPAVVNRLNCPESINDLNQVEIPPLTMGEADDFIKKLLGYAKVPFEDNAVEYLIKKINWLMPFFIQLSVQEIVDLYDQNETVVTTYEINLAFENICNRRNNIHFDSYYNRLKDTLRKDDYSIAIDILNTIAKSSEITKSDLVNNLKNKKDRNNISSIIEALEYDGYINLRDIYYTFNSPILQLWWKKIYWRIIIYFK